MAGGGNLVTRRYRTYQGGRGPGNLGAFAAIKDVPAVYLTGAYGRPSWPSKNLPEQRRALPKADTKRQVKADRRLKDLGGDAYLKRGREDRRAAA